MALDVNKIRKTQVSTTPTTHNTDAGSTAVSSKPIDLTNSNVQNSANNTEIVNYIRIFLRNSKLNSLKNVFSQMQRQNKFSNM